MTFTRLDETYCGVDDAGSPERMCSTGSFFYNINSAPKNFYPLSVRKIERSACSEHEFMQKIDSAFCKYSYSRLVAARKGKASRVEGGLRTKIRDVVFGANRENFLDVGTKHSLLREQPSGHNEGIPGATSISNKNPFHSYFQEVLLTRNVPTPALGSTRYSRRLQ